TVLRPARVAAAGHRDWLVRALRPAPAVPDDADEPPVQFLHLDDLARACDLARRRRLDGAYNVAPPGSIPGDLARPLVGAPPRVAAAGRRDRLVRALRPARAVPDDADGPPVQFLHLDDLARACALARRRRRDGAYTVAPPGSIPGALARSLVGAPPRVPLPERLARHVAHWRFRWGLGPTPPELVPYTLHPWVVAADRLRAEGWTADVSNEEACVEAHDVGAWATMSPRRRQEIALGVAGAGLAGAAAGTALLLRRWLRRR